MKKWIIIVGALVLILIICLVLTSQTDSESVETDTKENKIEKKKEKEEEFIDKINISIDGNNYTATLEDNETTRDFISKLPITMEMNDLNDNEKYYYFDGSFPINPKKVETVEVGDIMLYGNNCLVIFYESFETDYSYTKIGKIDNPNGLADIALNQQVTVSISQ